MGLGKAPKHLPLAVQAVGILVNGLVDLGR